MTKKNYKYLKSAILALVLMILGLAAFVYWLFSPVSSVEETIRFVIPKGQAISIIGSRLQEEGIIRNGFVFRVVVKLNNLETSIQAGSFDLSPSSSTTEIAQQLTAGTEDIWITILEGWRAEEIAESLDQQDLDFFDKELFLELAKDSEGMLYPDTYLIPREMSTENILGLLLNTFERKIVQGLAPEISNSSRDFEDILIMASLVEREARNYEQMREVSGILWNRIDLGMALQVDATLQYAAGYNSLQQTWWATPTAQQKQLISAFNTYLHQGLPPKPIANPSFNAVKATLLPLETQDLYYLHANDGNIYTAKTLQEHNENVNLYLR